MPFSHSKTSRVPGVFRSDAAKGQVAYIVRDSTGLRCLRVEIAEEVFEPDRIIPAMKAFLERREETIRSPLGGPLLNDRLLGPPGDVLD